MPLPANLSLLESQSQVSYRISMPSRTKSISYVKNYPGQIQFLRQLCGEDEPGFVFGLWVLLEQHGVRLSWGDTEVLSGQALQFVYHREAARAADTSVIQPLQALSRALGITWTEVTPSSAIKAYEIAGDWLETGAICLARFRQPLLLFGTVRTKFEPTFSILRLQHRLPDQALTREDCDRHEWKLDLDESNSLLRVNYVESTTPDWLALLPQIVRRAIANWRHESIHDVEVGLTAYHAFAEDLRNREVDFTKSGAPSWMGPLLHYQSTGRFHMQQFLDRVAPRFGGKPRQVLAKASSNYGQAAIAWRDFQKHLGRVYEREESGKALRGPDAHVHHWRDMGRREQAARQVEQAAVWEGRAIAELAKLLGT